METQSHLCDQLGVVKDATRHLTMPTTQAEHEVKGRLLLNVVVAERAAVLELLAREDEALLIGGNALLVLNLLLHVVDRVTRLHIERDGLARQRLDEDLRARAAF